MTEPTQKSLEEARELRAALSLGRDEYEAFMLVEEAEFDCKIALALDAARQEGREENAQAKCKRTGCDRPARAGWTHCDRHYTAGRSRPQP